MSRGLPFDRQTAESVRLLFFLVGLAFVMQVAFDLMLVGNTFPPAIDDGSDLRAFVFLARAGGHGGTDPGVSSGSRSTV